MTLTDRRKSTPRPKPTRRMPTANEIRIAYHMYGTHPTGQADATVMENLLSQLRAGVGLPAMKTKYSGWLNLELGLALQQTEPKRAHGHYLKSVSQINAASADRAPTDSLIAANCTALAGLLAARIDHGEREHGLQKRAVVGELGHLANLALDQSRGVRADFRGNKAIKGAIMEALVGGVLLSLDQPDKTHLPVPATPRQNSPYIPSRIGYKQTISGVQSISAYDYSLHVYPGTDTQPLEIVPVQVKAYEHDESDQDRYDPSILVLYGNRDLFVESFDEMQAMADSLEAFGRKKEVTDQLRIARSNVELALELHTEDQIEQSA